MDLSNFVLNQYYHFSNIFLLIIIFVIIYIFYNKNIYIFLIEK